MSRDGLFGIIIGRLEFGYSFDRINVYVQYYVNTPQNDWFDWMIKELVNKQKIIVDENFSAIINECVNKCLKKYLKKSL